MCVCAVSITNQSVSCELNAYTDGARVISPSSPRSLVQLDDFDAYFKDMNKDSAYKFSLQFEVNVLTSTRRNQPQVAAAPSAGHTVRKPVTIKARLYFQELKSVGLDLSHDAADLPVNRPKNRYTNILPCESLTAKHHGINPFVPDGSA